MRGSTENIRRLNKSYLRVARSLAALLVLKLMRHLSLTEIICQLTGSVAMAAVISRDAGQCPVSTCPSRPHVTSPRCVRAVSALFRRYVRAISALCRRDEHWRAEIAARPRRNRRARPPARANNKAELRRLSPRKPAHHRFSRQIVAHAVTARVAPSRGGGDWREEGCDRRPRRDRTTLGDDAMSPTRRNNRLRSQIKEPI